MPSALPTFDSLSQILFRPDSGDFMKLRLIAMLLAIPALVAGLLVISPAEAVSHSTYVTTKSVTITDVSSTSSQAYGKIAVSCSSSKGCSGTIGFVGSPQLYRAYSIKGRSTATLTLYMDKSNPAYPETHGSLHGDNQASKYKVVTGVQIYLNESRPSNIAPIYYTVQTETKSIGGIYYTVTGPTTGLKNISVELYRMVPGGNTKRTYRDEIFNPAKGISFIQAGSFPSSLGVNNASPASLRIRLTATDDLGKLHSWWWKGTDGATTGGGRYLRDASAVYGVKGGFDVPIRFGTITGGEADPGATVRAFAPPTSITTNPAIRRDFDVPSCANILSESTVTGTGDYVIPFLPYSQAVDARYMINTKENSKSIWLGKTGVPSFGSCYAITDYGYGTTHRTNLISLHGDTAAAADAVEVATYSLTVKGHFSGFTPTYSDTIIGVREQVPDLHILDTPLITEAAPDSSRKKTFVLPAGHYFVEVGRRTGCSAWYASHYPNNSAYLNGEDRGAEAWKAFTTLHSLPGSKTTGLESIAVEHGASYDAGKQDDKPSGYAGWMYRDHCKALGTGSYTTMWVNATSEPVRDANTVYEGAVVKGRVTRTGGRTNKEMMVRLSSSDGTKVLRTDLTDSSGYFYVAGLTDGTYTISVNSDSWRGIGRTFSGKHSITVRRGHLYNAGTLKFSG
jgi:hypothetical protein